MDSLTPKEKMVFRSLSSAIKIQNFLDTIPFNHEKNAETCMSPRLVLKQNKAHCIEGALLAGVALWYNKKEPLLVNLKVNTSKDVDHVITIYKEHGYYGAISKTNHSVLRFRDPVYKTIHELVMSYFHEYFLVTDGTKTLLGYSRPINVKKFGTAWITSSEDLWNIAEYIYDLPVIEIVPKVNKKLIKKAVLVERKGASIPEWKQGR